MIDLRDLERELREMSERSKLFELIKAEMQRRDHWKQKRRGRPNPETLKR